MRLPMKTGHPVQRHGDATATISDNTTWPPRMARTGFESPVARYGSGGKDADIGRVDHTGILRVRKRTLANLTDWPPEKVEALRRVLRGERLVAPKDAFTVERSVPHGHVEVLLALVRRLGLDRMIAPRRSGERDLVVAMVVERLLHPASKLATTRLWHTTTLAAELGVADADEDSLYDAMDWLLARQGRIEQRLAARHPGEGSPVFADVSGSYYEGRTCPLMRFGYSRDGKRGKPQVVYAVLSAPGGCPVAVEAYAGQHDRSGDGSGTDAAGEAKEDPATHRRRRAAAQPGHAARRPGDALPQHLPDGGRSRRAGVHPGHAAHCHPAPRCGTDRNVPSTGNRLNWKKPYRPTSCSISAGGTSV